MPDSLPMIQQMIAIIEALPTTGNGFRVTSAEELAVAMIGVAAPAYQADIDAVLADAEAARADADLLTSELNALRSDNDRYRDVFAGVVEALSLSDITTARALLATL